MQEINVSSLRDKALDVDPDLRFMALEDFRKYLSSSNRNLSSDRSASQISEFIPSLFRLLEDQNPDVQSQAVKTFEPTIRFLDGSAVVAMINRLYECVLVEHDKFTNSNNKVKRFTTSIPNMALRSIFNGNENDKKEITGPIFDSKVSRAVLDKLLPKLLKNEITFDSIEIFIDLIKNLGYVLTERELYELTNLLIGTAFKESGIVSKRALTGIEYLWGYAENSEILNSGIQQAMNEENVAVKYRICSIGLESGLVLNENLVGKIFTDVVSKLNISDDPVDFDTLLETNLIRENSLNVLDSLIGSKNPTNRFDILEILVYFVTYNPLDEDDDMDFDEDEDDIQFSDDENENDDEGDDGSWKLRYRAAIMVRSYLKKNPDSLEKIYSKVFSSLPIDDKNELVTNEVIKTLILIIDSTSVKNSKFQQLENKLVAKIVPEKINQLSKVLKLIESLNRFGEAELIVETFKQLEKLQLVHHSNFYKNVLENSDVLPEFIVLYISNDLIGSMNDKSFSVILENIKVFSLLLESPNKPSNEQGNLAIQNLIDKIENLKTYSGDIVQVSIVSVGALVRYGYVDKIESIGKTFERGLSSEGTKKTVLEVLVAIATTLDELSVFALDGFRTFLFEKLNTLISHHDENTQTLALTLLGQLVKSFQVDDSTIQPVIASLYSNTSGLSIIFEILGTLTEQPNFIETYSSTLLSSVKTLIDDEKITLNDITFFNLLKPLVQGKHDLFGQLYESFDLTAPLSAKVLAVISVQNKLVQEIEIREEQLIAATNQNVNLLTADPSLLFNIQFLGSVAEEIPLRHVTIDVIVKLLKDTNEEKTTADDKDLTNNNADVIKNAIAKTIGSIVQGDVNSQLGTLLGYYENSIYEKSRNYLITSLKSLLSNASDSEIESVWKSVWMGVSMNEFSHSMCGELRNSGDLLSKIVLRKLRYIKDFVSSTPILSDPASKLSVTYTLSVVIKQLISQLEDTPETKYILEALLFASIGWLSIVNIDLKQIIIGNLLTFLHNKPSIILPHLSEKILGPVYAQLKAVDEFKKVIKMGPYKFVVDEGLEIRKLGYEFLYAIGSLSNLEKFDVDLIDIATNIINQGILDEQIDIVVLSTINLINISFNHEATFKELLVVKSDILILNLKVQVKKKLSPKASTQDTETYENRVKAIVKLTKRSYQLVKEIDSEKLSRNAELTTEWDSYVAYLAGTHPNFYIASEA